MSRDPCEALEKDITSILAVHDNRLGLTGRDFFYEVHDEPVDFHKDRVSLC